MARPREFDEGTVLEAAGLCFWKQGYEATSVRDLVARTGITLRACVRSGLCSRVSPRRRWHFSALSLERTGRDRKDRISEALQDEMTDGFLRSRYEAAVVALCTQVAAMRGDGASPETIARAVHVERRRLTGAFKALTPEPWRSRIRTRTLAAYGDPVGPTIETLRVRGKSWNDIIDSAIRPGSRPSIDGSIDDA